MRGANLKTNLNLPQGPHCKSAVSKAADKTAAGYPAFKGSIVQVKKNYFLCCYDALLKSAV